MTLDQLERVQLKLRGDAEKIEVQLRSYEEKFSGTGRMPTGDDIDWHMRARLALVRTRIRLRNIKHKIKSAHRRVYNPHDLPLKLDSPDELLHAAYRVLTGMQADGVEFDPEDFAVKDAILHHLVHVAQLPPELVFDLRRK